MADFALNIVLGGIFGAGESLITGGILSNITISETLITQQSSYIEKLFGIEKKKKKRVKVVVMIMNKEYTDEKIVDFDKKITIDNIKIKLGELPSVKILI